MTLKKIAAIFLVLIMTVSACSLSIFSASALVPVYPELAEGYNRYFIYQPEHWKNYFTEAMYIYWWEGTEPCPSWPGYEAHEADAPGVFYYDVPKDVTIVIWNNGVERINTGYPKQYVFEWQTGGVSSEYYEPGESKFHPDGVESFNNMIYVMDIARDNHNEFYNPFVYYGDWFYYYGNGEYGTTPQKGDGEVFSDPCRNMQLRNFPEISVLIGDADLDKSISIKDATYIQKTSAEIVVLDHANLVSSDTNGDGVIDIKDATLLQKYLAEEIESENINTSVILQRAIIR